MDGQGSPDGPLGGILQGDRGTEKGHDPVARQLVHGSPVLIDRPDEDLIDLFHQAEGLFRIELLRHGGITGHVGEQHSYLFPFPLDPLPLGKDLLRQILGQIMLHLGDLFIKGGGWFGDGFGRGG